MKMRGVLARSLMLDQLTALWGEGECVGRIKTRPMCVCVYVIIVITVSMTPVLAPSLLSNYIGSQRLVAA